MGAVRSVKDKLKGFYHDVRGSVDADYRRPQPKKATNKKPKKKYEGYKASAKAKKTFNRVADKVLPIRRTIRQRNKEIDIKDYLK